MVELKNITKVYGSRKVLKNVSIEFEAAQTHVILGSSGSGKSTLLRILLGLIPATEGKVFIDGEQINPQDRSDWAFRVGYVPQEGGLFPHLTAKQNVQLVARLLGWTAKKRQDRTAELLELVGLSEPLLKRYPKEMSGGQRQRVALMRAAFLNPEIMILDEPLGALDPMIRSELQAELKTVFSKLNKTVILVTHDLGEAAYLGHSTSLFHDGALVQTGSLQELIESPKDEFVTQFINAQRTLTESHQVSLPSTQGGV